MLQFLGAVTDEDGTPIVGASVAVDYIDHKGRGQWKSVRTVEGGRYSMHLPARPHSQIYGEPDTLALTYAWSADFHTNVQLVRGSASENEVNFRLRRPRRIDAGGSITVTIDGTSSLCTDLDWLFYLKTRCEVIQISTASAGTLVIQASSTGSGGARPYLIFTGEPWDEYYDSITVPVKAGRIYTVYIQVPAGAGPQTYTVQTSLNSTSR